MKRLIKFFVVALLACTVMCACSCGNHKTGLPVVWAVYGLDSPFKNYSETCELTLREVVAADTVSYNGVEYEGKEAHMLIVKADVDFKNYPLDKWGVEFNLNHLNFKKTDNGWRLRSVKEDDGFELALSKAVNPAIDFNAEKQNYSGEIFMVFCLSEAGYKYLVSQKNPVDVPEYTVQIKLYIDGMYQKNVDYVNIGCLHSEVKFADSYKID